MDVIIDTLPNIFNSLKSGDDIPRDEPNNGKPQTNNRLIKKGIDEIWLN